MTEKFWSDSDGGHKLVRDQNGVLHAVFADITQIISTHTDRLIYARSTDDGASWSKYEIASATGTNSMIWSPALAVYDGQVYVVAGTGQGPVASYNLTLFKFFATGVPVPSSFTVSAGNGDYFRFTDIAIDADGMLNIAAIHGLVSSKVKFYRGAAAGTSFPEEIAVSAWTTSPQYPMYPALSIDADRNVYLAFEMFNNFNSAADASAEIRVYKRTSSNGNWSSFATVSSGFRNRHVRIINDSSQNLHLVYKKIPVKGGAMSLAYAVYSSAGGTPTYLNESIASAVEIHTPQIGLTTANIPVIQYVARDSATDYEIRQVSKKSATVWSAPRKIAPDYGRSVFLHMLPTVYDDKPHMLWFSDTKPDTTYTNYNTVYFNRAPDYVAPYQPNPPSSVVWTDKSTNSQDQQDIVVNVGNDWTSRAEHSSPIQYQIRGTRGVNYDIGWTTFSSARTTSNIHDRQTVTVSVQARDAAGNISEWSNTVAVYLADRTAPTRSAFSINADYVSGSNRYVSKNAVVLTIAAVDNVNGTAGQSGV
ncbi:MAG: hypothetical protein LBK68_01040, partial [Candidatus Margulisbacteria bacterium]|nr:hypothetical protein [Candidatus Margulisiibacteriota bacterium]